MRHRLTKDGALAHDEVQHALRQAGAVQDIDDPPGTARHQIGRFEDDGVAVAERRGDLPGRNGDRKIPRRDDADDAKRPRSSWLDVLWIVGFLVAKTLTKDIRAQYCKHEICATCLGGL
jgi:hypothetical protein